MKKICPKCGDWSLYYSSYSTAWICQHCNYEDRSPAEERIKHKQILSNPEILTKVVAEHEELKRKVADLEEEVKQLKQEHFNIPVIAEVSN